MGFSTNHSFIIELVNDNYVIVDDFYDESDLTGFTTLQKSGDQDSSNIINNSESQLAVNFLAPTPNLISLNTLDVGKAIHYADTWVNKGYDNTVPIQDPNYYNTVQYGYYSADCANYVSQCLRAGGMAYDYGTGKNSSSSDNSQWWFDEYPNPVLDNSSVCPAPWRYVPSFIQYWKNEGVSEVSATNSTVFPGNPLYLPSHVMICVGYNTNGVPIINGHNRDVYHVPLPYAGDPNSLKTLQISTSNLQINKPNNAYNFGTPGTSLIKTSSYLSSNESEYYKFTVVTTGQYVMYGSNYNSTNIDTYGYLYKETEPSNGVTLYMYEIARDDDSSSDGAHFSITQTLSPGTYYIKVRGVSKNITGNYYMNIKRN